MWSVSVEGFLFVGDYVMIEPIAEGDKVKAEISHILYKPQVQFIQQQGLWLVILFLYIVQIFSNCQIVIFVSISFLALVIIDIWHWWNEIYVCFETLFLSTGITRQWLHFLSTFSSMHFSVTLMCPVLSRIFQCHVFTHILKIFDYLLTRCSIQKHFK